MKKSVLIIAIGLTSLGLTALGFMSWRNVESEKEQPACKKTTKVTNDHLDQFLINEDDVFAYDVDSRFATTITKDQLLKAKTIADLVPAEATEGIESFRDIKIFAHSEKRNRFEKGATKTLNENQIKLLQSIDYSTNFNIEAYCKRKNASTGIIEDQCFVYYITVIPEKEAEFENGHEAFMKYLKEKSKVAIADLDQDKIRPGKIQFTVTKAGTINDVELTSTSGYTSIDKKMLKLIKNAPGKWNPAKNKKGEKIAQEFVYSFGKIGC